MMGVPIEGPSYVYGDNMSVIHNTTKPESVLKRKSNSICYHFVRETVAMRECLSCHIPTEKNVADLLTKILFGSKRRELVSQRIKLESHLEDFARGVLETTPGNGERCE